MTAKEMFEALGYFYKEDEYSINYESRLATVLNDEMNTIISFDKRCSCITFSCKYSNGDDIENKNIDTNITMLEFEAINKQVEELKEMGAWM